MTNYQAFLCIVGLVSAVAMAASVRTALRTRRAEVDDLSRGTTVRESQSPVLFWAHILSKVLVALVILIAVILALTRAAFPE